MRSTPEITHITRLGLAALNAGATATKQLLVWLLLLTGMSLTVRAQSPPTWDGATVGSISQVYGSAQVRAMATDANGNVFVTGEFLRSVAFGNTVLTSVRSSDLFVAKYVPATDTWAWAQRAGGTGGDSGYGITVVGTSVYVTGIIFNNMSNAYNVTIGTGSPVNGATAVLSNDLVLAKYTDNGNSATLAWTQVAGGTGDDRGLGVAVSGANVYVTGYITNNSSNTRSVVFGGNGITVGTTQVNGASSNSSGDVVLAKYIDNGSSATLGWTQVGGGLSGDQGNAVAVSGNSVYLTGVVANDNSNTQQVLFGGGGTTPGTVSVNAASSFGFANTYDMLLAKYTDNGPTGTLAWTQVGGGNGSDEGNSIAVSGSSVYVGGTINESATGSRFVTFGGGGTTLGTVQVRGTSATASDDLVLVKYQDNGATGSYVWSQVGGGSGADHGTGVAVHGSSVYLTGRFANNLANANSVVFGGSGTTPGTVAVPGASATASNDLALVKYQDNGAAGSYIWSQVGGSAASEEGVAVAVSGNSVYVGGVLARVSAGVDGRQFFGSANVTHLEGTVDPRLVLATAIDGGSTGSWTTVAASFNGGRAEIGAIASDAFGNVFATGIFSGQVLFGSTMLSSSGSTQMFVAKYVPAMRTWAWAQRGGGLYGAKGAGIAVSGRSVYVTGYFSNDARNTYGATFGGTDAASSPHQVAGVGSSFSSDLMLLKYTDNGTSATFGWSQVGGGNGADTGNGVAVSGNSVYVTGSITNNLANANGVVFGGSGTTAGIRQVNGATSTVSVDLLLAKYTDNGPSGTLVWTQVGGGTYRDNGNGLAVSGNSVYVAGNLVNNVNNFAGVLFGSDGTTPGTTQVNGAAVIGFGTLDSDILLAKYTDNGPTGTLAWTQVAGGNATDLGQAVAVSGSSVYLLATIYNNLSNFTNVVFGGNGTTPGTFPQSGASSANSEDILLAKYTDNGSSATFGWSQVGGGTGNDRAWGMAAQANSVYLTGSLNNNVSNANTVMFGGSGTTAGTYSVPGLATAGVAGTTTTADLLLAKYTDNGPTGTLAWTQVGGGPGNEVGHGVALVGSQVLVGGEFWSGGTYGPTTIAAPTENSLPGLAYLTEGTVTATHPVAAVLTLHPNPTTSRATLRGAAPGTTVQVLDVLGRMVATVSADATGTASLSGLSAGLYFVRAGGKASPLVVE